MKIIFVYRGFENIGIEYLSAVLKNAGHDTRLAFDPSLFSDQFVRIRPLEKIFDYRSQIIKQVIDYEPKLVAFSVVSSDYQWALKTAGEIKKISPAHITFGGIHPSSVPEIILRNQCVDSVVIGEGEQALLELAESIDSGRDDRLIKNVWFCEDGGIRKNEVRNYIEDLDSLPFPDKRLYYDVIPGYRTGYTILTRRGCLNSCSYCHNSFWDKTYAREKKRVRIRSIENVLSELVSAKKEYNFRLLRVNDDLFTSDESWLKEFSARYDKKIGIPLYCFGSPSTVNENVIAYLKRARCYQLCLGVQSVSEKTRRQILDRRDTDEQVREAISLCKKYKIRCVADNIIGLPGEKEEDILEMARFYNRNRVGRACIFWLIYFPRTAIVDKALEMGVLDKEAVKALEENPFSTANTLQNSLHGKAMRRYHLLLLLLSFLPQGLYSFILEKKLYRYFPLINPAFIEIPFTILSKDRLDVPRRRYYIRYLHFMRSILKIKIQSVIGKVNSFFCEKAEK